MTDEETYKTVDISIIKDEISRIKARLKTAFGEDRIDKEKLNNLPKEYEDSTNKDSFLYSLNDKDFLKDPEPNDKGPNNSNYNKNDNGYGVSSKRNPDGSYSGYTSDGKYFEENDFKSFNQKTLASFKEKDQRDGKETKISYTGRDKDELSIFAHDAIIDFDMTIGPSSSYPKDTKFWKALKEEYLKNEKNSTEGWNKVTRFVSDEVMERTEEEKKQNKDLIASLEKEEEEKERKEGNQGKTSPKQENNNSTNPAKTSTSPHEVIKRLRNGQTSYPAPYNYTQPNIDPKKLQLVDPKTFQSFNAKNNRSNS